MQVFLVLAFCVFVIGTFIGPGPYPPQQPGGPWWGGLRINLVSLGLALYMAFLIWH